MSSRASSSSLISAIKQTNGAIPKEVKELYGRSPGITRKALKSRKLDGRGSDRIDNFFKKNGEERKSVFNSNRPNNSQQPTKQLKPISQENHFESAQKASSEAKMLAEEINVLLADKEEIDVKSLIVKNTQMIMKMHESQEYLTAAMINRDTEIMTQISKRAAECTDFVTKEINEIRQEIDEIKENDEVEKISTVMACKRDLTKIWIRFTYTDDIKELKEIQNPPLAAKTIISQLKIDLSNIQWPIESAHFQLKTFSYNQQLPETALECVFVNSTIANRVKMEIRKFNSRLEADGKTHLIRYRVATDWSFPVRRILKVCNEMKRCEVVSKVLVTNDEIKILHNEIERKGPTTSKQPIIKVSSSIINSMAQLDALRRQLNDYNFKIPAATVYSKAYFEMSYDQRLEKRNENKEKVSTGSQMELEVTVSENESMYSSQHEHFD